MKYRFVKLDEVRAGLRKQDALSADIQAYAAEIDADFAEEREAPVEGEESAARHRAKTLRLEAKRRLKAERVNDEEIEQARINWLRNWIEGMEKEHANHQVQRELRLEREEDATPYDVALAQIEKMHGRATKELDTLVPAPLDPPNRAVRRGRPPKNKD